MPEALVTPSVLQWARERRELTPAELATRLKVSPDDVAQWERGEIRPSISQAETMARLFQIPLGYLYLKEPPALGAPIPDLRTIASEERGDLSINLRQVINDTLVKQDWYREFLLDEGAEPLPFVGAFSLSDAFLDVASDIRSKLKLKAKDRRGNVADFRRLLVARSEAAGVTVLRSGVVGSNTTRTLEVRECRGFALPDAYAPVVFVNGRDQDTAQVFTLIHELAHIWLGVSGISNLNPDRSPIVSSKRLRLERKCNEIAAEVLMPRAGVIRFWDARASFRRGAVASLAQEFRVSRQVALIRLRNLELIEDDQFSSLFEEFSRNRAPARTGTGGNPYRTLPVRNGKNITYALIYSALEGRIPVYTASGMLGVSEAVIKEAARRYGIV